MTKRTQNKTIQALSAEESPKRIDAIKGPNEIWVVEHICGALSKETPSSLRKTRIR